MGDNWKGAGDGVWKGNWKCEEKQVKQMTYHEIDGGRHLTKELLDAFLVGPAK